MRRWRFWGFRGSCIPCQCTPKFSICSSSIDDLSTAAPSTRFPRSRAVYSPCIGTYVGAKFDFCQWVRVFIQNATKTRKCNKKTPLLKHFSETLECCLKRTSMKNNIKRLVVAVFSKRIIVLRWAFRVANFVTGLFFHLCFPPMWIYLPAPFFI